MRPFPWRYIVIPTALVALLTSPVGASTVMQLNLAELVNRADRIFRGRVLSANGGTVDVAGGQLPVVTYRLEVDDVFRGDVTVVKGARIAEIRMLGKPRAVRQGNLRFVSALPEMPRLSIGEEYLLFATRPSAIGLSTTVGLGQGFFSIRRDNKEVAAVNAVNNNGLFRDLVSARAAVQTMSVSATPAGGPIAYDVLSRLIRDLVAARGQRR
jgi:hypothetical protein